jgi:hypothetical protein
MVASVSIRPHSPCPVKATCANCKPRFSERPAPLKSAPLKFALLKSAPLIKFAPLKFALIKFAPLKFALLKSAPLKFALIKFALIKFALLKFALIKFAPLKFAPLKFALLKSAPLKFAPLKFALIKFAPLKFARLPPFDSSQEACKRRISVSCSVFISEGIWFKYSQCQAGNAILIQTNPATTASARRAANVRNAFALRRRVAAWA